MSLFTDLLCIDVSVSPLHTHTHSMRWLSFILVATLLALSHADASIQVLNSYDKQEVVNEHATTTHTIEIACSDSNHQGTLSVGNYQLDVQCLEPKYNWNVAEIFCVPQQTIQHLEQSCLVGDVTRYNANQQAEADKIKQTLAAVRVLQDTQVAGRRLLQFDYLAIGLASAAILISTVALDTANKAWDKAVAVEAEVQVVSNHLNILQTNIFDTQRQLGNANDKIVLLNNATNQINQNVANVVASLASSNAYINQTTAATNNALNRLQGQIISSRAQIESEISYYNQQTANSLTRTLDQLQALADRVQQDHNALFSADEALADKIIGLNSQVWDLTQKTQLRRMLTQSFFNSLQTVQSDMMALTTDSGAPPLNGGVFSGPGARLLIEQLHYNYVTPVAVGGGNLYQVVSHVISFWYSSDFAIDNNKASTPISRLYKSFGPVGCVRPFVSDGPQDTSFTGPQCNIWVEVKSTVCNAVINGAHPTQFSWKTANSTQPSNGQPNVISNSYCTVSPFVPTNTYNVFKSAPDWMAFANQELCTVQIQGEYQISTLRSGSVGYFPSSTACNKTYSDQISLAANNNFVPLVSIGALVQAATTVIQPDVQTKELYKFGAAPGGLFYEDMPFVYNPIRFDDLGAPIYDGTGSFECFKSSWSVASRLTVCAYAATPMSSPNRVNKEILASVSGPVCTDTSGTTCYPVGDSDVSTNIFYGSDSTPPESFVFLGDINRAASIGIWDVPDDQLEINSNPAANEKRLSYYNFAPGSTSTPPLSEWQTNNGYLYDPRGMAVSASGYHFPAQLDYQGFPVCSVPGGLPDAQHLSGNYTVTEHNCYAPFHWLSEVQPQAIGLAAPTSTPSANALPAYCTLGNVAHVLYQDYASEVAAPTINATTTTLFQSSYLLTFWYRKQPGVGDQGAVSVIGFVNLVFGVDAKGQPYFARDGVFDSRSTAIGDNQDVRDNIDHQISWIVALGSNSVTATLFIDGRNQGQFISTYPAVTSPVTLNALVAGPYAAVKQATIYPGSYTQQTINQLYSCQQAFMNSRCSAPVVEVVSAARQVVTQNNFVTCTASTLLMSSLAFDALYPPVAPSTASYLGAPWSLSFWTRLVNDDAATLFTTSNQHSSVTVTADHASDQLAVTVNGATIISNSVFDGSSHFWIVVFSSNQVTLYRDGRPVGAPVSQGALSSTLSYQFTSSSYDVFMVKFYNKALFLADVKDEFTCALPSQIAAVDYVPPIGYCVSESGSNRAYCRQPLLCAGHCSAFSVIDKAAGTFTPSSFQCDIGWSLPDCTTRCARTDPATGECLQTISNFATGLIPNGQWCRILKQYKPILNAAQGILSMVPRNWLMSAQISVPSGVVTQVVSTSGCPLTTVQPFADNSFTLTMQNKQASENNLRVFLLPDAVYKPLPGHTAAACTRPCCTPLGQSLVVPGNSVQYYQVPTCGNMTVVLQLADGTANCSTFTGESIAAAFQTSNVASVPPNVLTAISVAQSQGLQNLMSITSSVLLFTTNLMILAANSTVSSDVLVTLLAQQRDQILAQGFNTSLFSTNNTVIPFDVGANAQQLLADSQAQLAIAAAGIQAVTDMKPQFDFLQNQTAVLAAKQNQTLFALDQNLKDLAAAIAYSASIENPGGLSFNKIVSGIADETIFLAQQASHTVSGVADSLLSLIPGLGGGGIVSDIAQIIKFAIYAALALVAYKIYKSEPVQDALCSKKKAAATRDEPTGKSRQQREQLIPGAASTGGRYAGRLRARPAVYESDE
jgi:hypothetical protein